ncbi:MAG: DNA translocase FtsK [Oscillospiraceae bacterium]|jgi:S-DNA-T family DNA segregation ATPase FtsK/SpoIIIE|nr:DNA translocase FtsK [Oscillospiraceae bacterium]
MAPVRKTAPKKETAREKAEKARSGEALARDKRRRKLWSLVLFCAGILLIVFSFVGNVNEESKNAADHINTFLRGMFGFSVFFTGPILIYISVMISMNKGKGSVTAKLIQLSIILLIISAGIQIVFFEGKFENLYENGIKLQGGGLVSILLGWLLMRFGQIPAGIMVVLIAFIVFMLASDITLHEFLKIIAKPFRFIGRKIRDKSEQMREDSEHLRMLNEEKKKLEKEAAKSEPKSEMEIDISKRLKFASIEAATNAGRTASKENPEDHHGNFQEELHAYISDEPVKPKPEAPPVETAEEEPDDFFKAVGEYIKEKQELEALNEQNEQTLNFTSATAMPDDNLTGSGSAEQQYTLPPVTLLIEPVPIQSTLDIESELAQNSETLVETLKSFGVLTKIVGVCRGPAVTRYELQPAEGVKIAKITGLIDDIALNLATAGVRIEAPIPNKRAVGIEVPNRTTDTVHIRSLIDSEVFRGCDSKLAAVIGMDISGEIIVCDIAKMPHILIAGTTGSGKSVCVNSIIMSILFRATPEDVRFVMIDPKMVEFTIYNGIPHLLIPVVTDPKKAAGALSWAVTEMLNRNKTFAEYGVRDLSGYNSLCVGDPELEKMPQVVIFIDEFADLMMAASGEVESGVCRLAQMGRAAGIHLVIATQRPSVDVITGLIKANIPSRIALRVASQIDSRTIIDSAGAAEKLLGKGDMLYNPVGTPKPIRVQGCWVSEKEVERTVDFIKKSFVLDYDESVIKEIEENAELVGLSKSDKEKMTTQAGELDVSDDKLDEAIDAVIEAGQASTSYLQRKLKLGYGRAARLIDIMEQMGIVGTFEGSKPRQVIMTRQEWLERKINKQD